MKAVVARLGAMKLTNAAGLVEEKAIETLTYFAYPSTHWRQIRTNNPLKRIIRGIRRRTRVVGDAFQDGTLTLMLAAVTLTHNRDQVGPAALSRDGSAAQPGKAGLRDDRYSRALQTLSSSDPEKPDPSESTTPRKLVVRRKTACHSI